MMMMKVPTQRRFLSALPHDPGPIGAPLQGAYDTYSNKNRVNWTSASKRRWFQKLDPKMQMELVRNRLGGREYVPVDQQSYSVFSKSQHHHMNVEGHDFDVGKTPVFRNKVASVWDILDVTGTPYSFDDVVPGKKPAVLTFGKATRPQDTAPRRNQRSPQGKISNFMGTFINAYTALDCDKWDMDALLDDIEVSDSPYQVISHLTQFLEQKHMLPRKLTDSELSKIFLRCTSSPESEIHQAFLLAAEKHSPGMLSLRALCTSAPNSSKFPTMQFERMLSAGTQPTTTALNALLNTHMKCSKTEVSDSMTLYDDMREEKMGPDAIPNIITYEIVMRILKKSGQHEKLLQVFNQMLDSKTPATTYILNVTMGSLRVLGNFDSCAELCENMCINEPLLLLPGSADDEPKEITLPRTQANNNTFRHLFKQLLVEKVNGMPEAEFMSRLLWIIDSYDLLLEDALTYWNQKELLPILIHCNKRLFEPISDNQFSVEQTSVNVSNFLAALADAFDESSDPILQSIYRILAESHYRHAAELNINNTPKIFTSVLRIFAACGDATRAAEIIEFLSQTPFMTHDHQKLADLATERSDNQKTPQLDAAVQA